MKIDCIICHHQGNLVLKSIHTLLQSKFVIPKVMVATSDPHRTFHGVKTLYIPGGPARKRNIAYRFSESDYIAFFDDDVEVSPTCIHEMLKVLLQERVGMVFGKTLNMEHRDQFDEAGSFLTPTGFLWSRGDRTKDVGQFEKVEPILAGKSASCMIRREAFAKAGFFDEGYEILGEETDLAWRVWLSGYKVLYVPQSVAYHAFNTRFKPMNFYTHQRVYFNGCKNYLAMLTTNLGSTRLLVSLPLQVIAWTLSSLGMFITGKFKAGFYILKAISYYFRHLSDHLLKRRRVQGSRKVGEKELMKLVMRHPPLSYYLKRFLRYLMTGLHG